MSPWANFILNLLLRAPVEILLALLRLLLLLVLFIIILLLKLWEWILWLLRTQSLYPEETEEDCGRLPETLVRRPDPAIYSQQLLMSQGLPVTWNNPDIWVAPASNPGAIEPDSYHLKADTDYIVSVQAHNASTDAAIGTRVRLVYRPWSFNSPDLVPVETDAAGNEVFKFVDIPPLGAAVAQFSWHTPALAPGQEQHFCLQAHLFHPLDLNTANNMGQENTNVAGLNPSPVLPGDLVEIEVPLFNTGRQDQEARFRWDIYEIDLEDQVELKLHRAQGKARLPLSDRLGHVLPSLTPSAAGSRPPREGEGGPVGVVLRAEAAPRQSILGRLDFGTPKSRFTTVKTRYTGFDVLRQRILSRDYSLPAGMQVNLKETGPTLFRLAPNQASTPVFQVRIPPDANPGDRIPLNIVAENAAGGLVGGVTIFFEIQ